MTNTVRETQRADELKPGDWAAEILSGDPWAGPLNGRVEYTHPFTDDVGNARVLLVVTSTDGGKPETIRPLAETSFRLLTGEDQAEARRIADRVRFVAGLREFADWFEANPWAPVGWDGCGFQDARVQVDLHGADEDANAATVARVREYADRLGVKLKELDDRTDASIVIGAVSYSVIAWHKDGRPAEPAPEPAAEDLGGGVTDEGLVDESEPELMPSGLTKAADESRGVLAGTTPVVTYFSFGHGQSDPDTGKSLINHYVTVVAPTYEACREAMFASRFGREWSFDYLAGTARATEWIPRWTEHEVIVAAGTGGMAAELSLEAARAVLVAESPCPACGHPEGQHVEDGDVCEVCGCDRADGN